MSHVGRGKLNAGLDAKMPLRLKQEYGVRRPAGQSYMYA